MSTQIASSNLGKIKLSDTQLVMMSAATQREDRCLVAPANLKGGAARKVAAKLIAAGLVKKIKAKPGMAAWRRDEEAGQSYALKLTAAGLKAIAVEEEDDAEEAARGDSKRDSRAEAANATTECSVADAAKSTTSSDEAVSIAPVAAPRAGSKLADVIGLLGRDGGASIDELIAATDWLPHTTRAALTGVRKRGYAVERRCENSVIRCHERPTLLMRRAAAEVPRLAAGCRRTDFAIGDLSSLRRCR